jgi:hypothetical protein
MTRICVTRITLSGASIVPSASVHSLLGWLGIPRASSAPARVPVSQPAAAPTRWSSVLGNSSSGSIL